MVDLKKIKALTFDVGGTVFDWRGTIEEELSRLAAEQGIEDVKYQLASVENANGQPPQTAEIIEFPKEAIKDPKAVTGGFSNVSETQTSLDDLKNTLKKELKEELLLELKNVGLKGVEVYYNDYTKYQIEYLLNLTDKLNLIPCGGSDYHASGNPNEITPGTIGPPIECLIELQKIRDSI